MKRLAIPLFLCFSLTISAGGCATIAGTAVSPLTGGVDLTRYHLDNNGEALLVPFVFLGGLIAGPFASLWNGVRQDITLLDSSGPLYWSTFPQIFQPFEFLDRGHATHAMPAQSDETAGSGPPQ